MEKTYNKIVFKPLEGFFFFIVIATSIGLLASPYYKYAIIPVLVVLFLFILSKKPQLGYYMIIFLVPFEAYRGLTDAFQFLTISKIVGLWLFIIVVLYFILTKKLPLNLQSSLWPWFSIFLIISFFSALLSDYSITSFEELRRLVSAYAFFALTLILVSENGMIRILPKILIISISITALLSIIGYIFNIPLFVMQIGSESVKRAIGTAFNPNHFAAMIIFAIPVLLHWLFTARRIFEKMLSGILFAMNIAAIVLTYSRGAAVVLLITLFLLFIEHIKKFRPKYLGFITSIIGVSIIMVIIFIPPSYWARQKSLADTSDVAISRRISYLSVGWEAFKENPILGSGFGAFQDIYAGTLHAFKYADDVSDYKRYAHNTYLEVLIGDGFMGFVVFLIFIWLTLRNFHHAKNIYIKNGQNEMADLMGAFRISFMSLLIYFLFLSNVYHKYFWLSLALSQISLRVSRNFEGQRHGKANNSQ
jgi:putative inorganic carbon (hco3(-)) transporter